MGHPYGHGNAVQAEAKAEYQTLARALDIVCSGELGEATVYPACLFLELRQSSRAD